MMVPNCDRRGALACAPLFYLCLAFVVCVTFLQFAPATEKGPRAQSRGPVIRLSEGSRQFEVHGLPAALLTQVKDAERMQASLMVAVEGSDQPMLGAHRIEREVLIFEPRFPLSPGVSYVAQLREPLPAQRQRFAIPKPPRPPTDIVQIYPTSAELPENQLRFYVYFSAPMSRGQAYQHLRLENEKGDADEAPFLEIGEELWNRECTRFTLFLDPGRVKRGLRPREEAGPVLEEGRRYTLVVDKGWTDASGNPLKESFRKSFRVLQPDDTPPDPSNWKIEPPSSDNEHVLTVVFPEPLDRGLLERVVWVEDSAGERLDGDVLIDRQETRWRFRPRGAWDTKAAYSLAVQRILEDRAGNRLGRKFEVDVFEKVDAQVLPEIVRLPFRTAAP